MKPATFPNANPVSEGDTAAIRADLAYREWLVSNPGPHYAGHEADWKRAYRLIATAIPARSVFAGQGAVR